MHLPDGTIVPSFLSVTQQQSHLAGSDRLFSDTVLRAGRVITAHAPTAATNTNGKFWEYDVKVGIYDQGLFTELIYPRAQIASFFGGLADKMFWRPRLGNADNDDLGLGSHVLLACVNGDTAHALIIGGYNPATAAQQESEGERDYLTVEVNGASLRIEEDGTIEIRHKGATKDDGTVKDDDDTKTSTITMDKNGDVKIATGAESKNLVHLDSQNKKIFVDATEGEVHIKAQNNVKVLSQGLLVGDATDAMVKGTTYRSAEQSLHMQLSTGLTTLMGLVTTAGAGLSGAGVAHLTPVVGPIIGAPLLSAAGAAVTGIVPIITQMLTAIQTFEAQAATYLSTKNKLD
jgi:hypothetical protein